MSSIYKYLQRHIDTRINRVLNKTLSILCVFTILLTYISQPVLASEISEDVININQEDTTNDVNDLEEEIEPFDIEESGEEEPEDGPEVNTDDWSYSVSSSNTITIKSYNGTKTDVTVPSAINNLPVTKIAYSALAKKGIQNLTIPSTISSMTDALKDDTSVIRVEFQEGITVIPQYALNSAKKVESVILPEGILEIKLNAFSEMSSLSEINLPDSITKIGNNAFNGCLGLKELLLPENLISIGNCALKNTGITRLEIPAKITSMSYALEEDTSIKEVEFLGGRTAIPSYALYRAKGINRVILPDGVETISSHAFQEMPSLTEIKLPESLKTIGTYAFNGCSSLEELSLPENLTTIDSRALSKTNIKRLEIPVSITRMSNALQEDTSIKEVVFLDGRTAIPSNALYEAKGVKSIYLPKSLTTIGQNAFYGSGLDSIVIPESVNDFGRNIVSDNTEVIAENLYSFTTIHCFLNNLKYSYQKNERKDDSTLVTEGNNFSFIRSASGNKVSLDLNYQAKEVTANSRIAIVLGQSYYLDGCEVSIDGNTVTNPKVGEDIKIKYIIVPIQKNKGKITITIGRLTAENEDLRCMALFSKDKALTSISTSGTALLDTEVIGLLEDEALPLITARGSYENDSIKIWGNTKPGTTLTLYDGENVLQTFEPRFDGTFEVKESASLLSSRERMTFKLVGNLDGKTSECEFVVSRINVPKVEQFVFYAGSKKVDMLEQDKAFFVLGNKEKQRPYTAEIKLSQGGPNTLVYLVASNTKQGEKTLQAHWDEASGKYYAKGYFDDDKSFAMKRLGLRVVQKESEEKIRDYIKSEDYKKFEQKLFPNKTKSTVFNEEKGCIESKIQYDDKNYLYIDYYPSTNRSLAQIFEMLESNGIEPEQLGQVRVLTNHSGQPIYAISATSKSGKTVTCRARGNFDPSVFGSGDSFTMSLSNFFGLSYDDKIFSDFDFSIRKLDTLEKAFQHNFNTALIDSYLLGVHESLKACLDEALSDIYYAAMDSQLANALKELYEGADDFISEHLPFDFTDSSLESIGGFFSDVMNKFLQLILDPSGIVYEAVLSNPVEGAKAGIYYKEAEDPENIGKAVFWNAEEFGYVNPQITAADGAYAWDVPEGDWKVKVTKDGYESAETAWLPVPPPQLGINIPLVSYEKPVIENIYANESGLTVKFSKYLKKSSVSSKTKNSSLEGDFSVVVKDASAQIVSFDEITYNTSDDEEYADTFIFKRDLSGLNKQILDIMFSDTIVSYAGTNIDAASRQVMVKTTPTVSVLPNTLIMQKDENRTIEFSFSNDVEDGTKLICNSDVGELVSMPNYVTIKDKKASVDVKLLGYVDAQLTFDLDGTDLTVSCPITSVISKKAANLSCIEAISKTYDKTEIDNPNVESDSDGRITFVYYDNNGNSLEKNPSEPGNYKLVVSQEATNEYAFEKREVVVNIEGNVISDKEESVYDNDTEYSITYHLSSGINNSMNPKKYIKKALPIVLGSPNRTGYSFEGWYSDADLRTKITSIPVESSGNIDLYAKWTQNRYRIVFDKNGGKGSLEDMNAVYDSSPISLSANKFKKSGYTFVGWATSKNKAKKTIVKYANKQKVKNLTSQNEGKVVLYAVWVKNTKKYKITYSLGKGGKNNKSNPSKYTIVTKTIKLKSPSKKGYKFVGWYTDSKYKNRIKKIKKGSYGKIKLYAKWKKKS